MIRKQVYIEARQEEALRRRARTLGISQAELMRRALDAVLHEERIPGARPGQEAALEKLLDNARRISWRHRFPESYRFNREEVYEERLSRWDKPS
jgi:hypothetical protein